MKLSAKIRTKIARAAGIYTSSDAAGDEMNAILLQLTMALMMIFLIAFSLFRLKTTEELEPVAKMKAEQQLNFQRQELILALERVEEYYRIRYGLKAFANLNDQDVVVYDVSPVIANGALADIPQLKNVFLNGAKNGANDYSNEAELPKAWRSRTIIEAGIEESSLQEGNSLWLDGAIAAHITLVRNDLEDMQYQAAALIQSYLAANPEKVDDPGVRSLLEQYVSASEITRAVLLNELDRGLKNYAFAYLEKQIGVKLIKDLDDD